MCSTKELRRVIMDMYEVHPPIVIAELTGKSVGYVRCVASAMGIRSGGRGKNFDDLWTPEEEKMVRECYGKMPVKELSRQLGRTAAAIQTKATRLGIGPTRCRPWTEAEDRLIREDYARLGARHVCKKTGRSYDAVKHRAKKLGATRDKATHPWSLAESRRYEEIRSKHRRVG